MRNNNQLRRRTDLASSEVAPIWAYCLLGGLAACLAGGLYVLVRTVARAAIAATCGL